MSKWLTLEEAVADLLRIQTDKSICTLRTISKAEMRLAVNHIGTDIRYRYRLWNADNPLVKQWFLDRNAGRPDYYNNGVDYHPDHPDAVTLRILELVWEQANEFWERVKQ